MRELLPVPACDGLLKGALTVFCWLFVITLASQLHAQQDTESPTDGTVSDSVWFDAERQEVLPVSVQPKTDDSLNRNSRWLPQAERVEAPDTSLTGGGAGGSGGMFGTGLTIGNLFGWLLLILIVAAAVAAIAYALSKAEVDFGGKSRSQPDVLSTAPDQQTIERMKHLPAELRRTDVNLRTEAKRLMDAGRYDQAIILLFGHQLLLLDHAHMLRLNRGKTNRKYVRETRRACRESAARLQDTVTTFERSYFGRHAISADKFHSLWQSNLELEQTVQQRREAAA